MAYKINQDNCALCGACMDNCPVAAIYLTDDNHYKIFQESCIECGTCAANCPISNITNE